MFHKTFVELHEARINPHSMEAIRISLVERIHISEGQIEKWNLSAETPLGLQLTRLEAFGVLHQLMMFLLPLLLMRCLDRVLIIHHHVDMCHVKSVALKEVY